MTYRRTLPEVSSGELLLAARQSTGRWDLVVSALGAPTAADLAQEFDAIEGREGSCTLSSPRDGASFLAAVAAAPAERVLVLDASAVPDEAWASVSLQRDRLARAGSTIVVTTERGARALLDQPHLSTWITRTAYLRPEHSALSDEDREERLAALRTHYAMSDDEFIARWKAKGFPTLEPAYGEWLMLLNRGDLLAESVDTAGPSDAPE